MSVSERLADAVTKHSRIVLVALLLTTALIGSGVSMVDDDSSLDQFESDSPEVDATEYISDNFTTEDQENTTTIQLIKRGDNVLTRESLLRSLEFQQEVRANESINATLVDDDPIFGVENILAINEIRTQEFDELEERADELETEADALNDSADELEAEADALNDSADELEAEGEELNESADELEEDADRLERMVRNIETRAEELEADAEELEEDQEDLEARTGVLQGALERTAELQGEYEQAQDEQERAEINDSIEEEWTNATEAADLNATQEAQFEAAGWDVREITSLEFERGGVIEGGPAQITPEPDPDEQAILSDALNETAEQHAEYEETESDDERDDIDDEIQSLWGDAAAGANLDSDQETQFVGLGEEVRDRTSDIYDVGPMEAAFEAGTAGVLADEIAALEQRGAELEERGEELEDRGNEIESLGEDVEERGEELEERGDELEAWADELEERGDELEEWGDRLEERGDELEERGDQLEEDFDELEDADDPTLDEQIEFFEELDDEEFEAVIADGLDDGDNETGALSFMPSDYEPGSLDADARMTFLTQSTDGEGMAEMGDFDDDAMHAQLELRELANDQDEEYVVFGVGVITDEIDRSMADSLVIVGPLALLFVVAALFVAYRDPLDIALGVAGIGAVLVWTFGFMGWTGIAFNQMFVAVPVLLIGLSIDYAIHVFMRHREQREAHSVSERRTENEVSREQREGLRPSETRTESEANREQRDAGSVTDGVSTSMVVALAGVGVALVWVTATTMIGFLANLISPIAPIREFGIVSAFGILSALIVFGVLVPATKVELDEFLESRGFDRRKRAFGTDNSRFSKALTLGAVAARKAPFVVLILALVFTAGGVYGASQVDTSFEEEDFLAEDPPAWMDTLPGPLSPGEYHANADLEYVNENFQREDSQARILLEGEITDPETLERVDEAKAAASESESAYILASGEADVESPLSMMDDAAAANDSFNETFEAADTTGDGVPNENLTALYDELFEVEDDAGTMIYRTGDGEYEALQLIVAVRGDATTGDVTAEMREIAAGIDDGGTDPRWEATATGDPVVNHVIEGDLLETVLESLGITLVAVFVFLSLAYWLTGKGAVLGAVTLLPVALSVSWILGSMYLMGMPFNVLTGMITSLTIGLGVAYSIHVSSRYTLELERQGDVWDAMHTTVTGTGGALLGSAATTVGGFGVLVFAILPVLRQFGIITGLTIIYAFLASVVVLPTLLVLWTRYFGPPDVSFDGSVSGRPTTAVSDGGDEYAKRGANPSSQCDADVDSDGGGDE